MDLYLPSTEPGMTLQEMIDVDIKGTIGLEDGFPLDSLVSTTDLNSLDLSGMSTLENELDLKSFEPLFDPLDRLDDMDVIIKEETEDEDDEDGRNRGRRRLEDMEEDNDVQDRVDSWMNMSAMTNYNLDIENSLMVDPSSVIPSTLPSRAQQKASVETSTTLTQSQTSLSSSLKTPLLSSTSIATSAPSAMEGGGVNGHILQAVKKEDETAAATTQLFRGRIPNGLPNTGQSVATQVVLCPVTASTSSGSTTSSTLAPKSTSSLSTAKLINGGIVTNAKLVNGESGQMSPLLSSTSKSTPTITQLHTIPAVSSPTTSTISQSTFHHNSTISHNGRTIHARIGPFQTVKSNGIISTSKSKYTKMKRDKVPEEKVFPKPAYSYSCLIALALKNSSSGSLPVSEIYNFMCEHFPYFRTAPNGWKNSVRHNLSLNKCFEKIEKPVVSGGNQRKGCLWALNPERAHKMDDEVQKWSKKGLQEIKQSMTYPEVLESLERGEMKFETSSGASSSCSDDEEEFEEADPLAIPEISSSQTIQPFKLGTPVSTPIVATGGLKGQHGRLLAGSVRTISYSNPSQHHHNIITSNGSLGGQLSRVGTLTSHVTPTQIQIRKPLPMTPASSQEIGIVGRSTELSHPAHSLSEISIQSNGSIVDDFGNEITIEGDIGGVLNPSGTPNGSGGSLILRQTNLGTTIRTTPIANTNNFYTTSPLSSPHHQSTLNRLVMTAAKQS